MPKKHTRRQKTLKKTPAKPAMVPTLEVDGYLSGIFHELSDLAKKYEVLATEDANLQARMDRTEDHLRATRDHLVIAITEAADETVPRNWSDVLKTVKFVGMRLADACVILLKEQKRMTPEKLLIDLNQGMFRFRSNTPLREIHATLLRHPSIQRVQGDWVWTGEQPSLHMPKKVVDNVMEEKKAS